MCNHASQEASICSQPSPGSTQPHHFLPCFISCPFHHATRHISLPLYSPPPTPTPPARSPSVAPLLSPNFFTPSSGRRQPQPPASGPHPGHPLLRELDADGVLLPGGDAQAWRHLRFGGRRLLQHKEGRNPGGVARRACEHLVLLRGKPKLPCACWWCVGVYVCRSRFSPPGMSAAGGPKAAVVGGARPFLVGSPRRDKTRHAKEPELKKAERSVAMAVPMAAKALVRRRHTEEESGRN